jgi:mono/diheme cytochrome c family protein
LPADSTSLLLLDPQDNFVGQAPWPAADPLVGLLERSKSRTGGSGADAGVRPTIVFVIILLLTTAGCRQDMHDQPRYKPLARSSFFEDGRASRPLVAGTIARGHLHEDTRLYTGKDGNNPIARFPFPITKAVLERGQQRFNIYCSPCHDRAGTGLGMVVRRGLRRPPSYHIDRLRAAPVGYFFDVITNGFGAMPDYAAQIQPQDRWAIVAYIRVLQRSQNAKLADVPPDQRAALGSPR